MIRRLTLQNFRKHEDTEIHFDESDQLILIAGNNGVGKSTLVEAILFALYGEGREGKRHLDRLVKRGYELEGMTVELVFEVAGTEYQVTRRREGRSATAVLYGNGEPLVESVQAVTGEVSRLLGMDAAAFKLAVLAQQKELDGLAAHSPTTRRRMIGRLLRIEAVTKARDKARVAYNTLVEVVKSLGSSKDIDTLRVEAEKAAASVVAQKAELALAEKEVDRLRNEIGSRSQIEEAWAAASAAQQRAQGELDSAKRREKTAEAALAEVGPPPVAVPEPAAGMDALAEAQLVVEQRLAEIGEAESSADQAKAIRREAAVDRERLVAIQEELAGLGDASAMRATREKAAAAEAAWREAAEQVSAATSELAELNWRVSDLQGRLERVQAMEGVCVECGQPITDEHRTDTISSLEAELAEVSQKVGEVEATRQGNLISQARAESENKAAIEAVQQAEAREARRLALQREEAGVRRRLSVYQPVRSAEVDPAEKKGLIEWRGALAAAVAQGRRAEESRRASEAYTSNLERRQEELEEARRAVKKAEAGFAACAPSSELAAQMEEIRRLKEDLASEAELISKMAVAVAVAEGDLRVVEQAVQSEEERSRLRAEKTAEAEVTSQAARVLSDLSDQLVREVRPALAAAVGEVLTQLSNGRFSKISITDEYEIQVYDDGDFRDISEISGGERDLVALAMRLGLSALVSERQGAGGGFLILDECFGSQDEERRRTILDALRNLRGTYRQIFLISHVGGLEDLCDRVVEVTVDADRTTASVRDL